VLTLEVPAGAVVVPRCASLRLKQRPGRQCRDREGGRRLALPRTRASSRAQAHVGRPDCRLPRGRGRRPGGPGSADWLQDHLQPRRQDVRPSVHRAPRWTRATCPNDLQIGQTGKIIAPELSSHRHLGRHPAHDRHQGRAPPSSRSIRTVRRRSSRPRTSPRGRPVHPRAELREATGRMTAILRVRRRPRTARSLPLRRRAGRGDAARLPAVLRLHASTSSGWATLHGDRPRHAGLRQLHPPLRARSRDR